MTRNSIQSIIASCAALAFVAATPISAKADSITHAGAVSANSTDVIEWPYAGGEATVTSEQSAVLLAAFGATNKQVQNLTAYQEALANPQIGPSVTITPPLVASEAEPIKVLRAESEALAAVIQVYGDGSLGLSLLQLGPRSPSHEVLDFEGTRVSFVDLLNTALTAPAGVSGCKTPGRGSSGWNLWQDCFVYDSKVPPVVSMSFYADYARAPNYGESKITATGGGAAWCLGGSATSNGASIYRPLGNSLSAARSIHTATCTVAIGSIAPGVAFTQDLWVSPSEAWSTKNF